MNPVRPGSASKPFERLARLIRHPEPSLRGREPSDDRGRESVHTCELRLRLRSRSECLERRLVLPASSVQLARHHLQQHRGGRVNLWLGDLPSTAQRALSFVELSHPDRPEGQRAQRGRQYRLIAQAVPFGQGYRLTPPFARGCERDRL